MWLGGGRGRWSTWKILQKPDASSLTSTAAVADPVTLVITGSDFGEQATPY
jgi:hypothetical protein